MPVLRNELLIDINWCNLILLLMVFAAFMIFYIVSISRAIFQKKKLQIYIMNESR